MPTNYPTSLDTTTQLPDDQTDTTLLDRPGVDHAQEHANLSDAVRAIEAELGADPSGSSYSTVKARLDAISGGGGSSFAALTNAANVFTAIPQTIGAGDHLNLYANASVTPSTVDIRKGTSGSPDTDLKTSFKVSRYLTATKAAIEALPGLSAGADGVDALSAVYGLCKGDSATEIQTVGVAGVAINDYAATRIHNDACGVYGTGLISAAGGTGYAIGGFFNGRRQVDTANAHGLEVGCANFTATAVTHNPNAGSDTAGIWITSRGNSKNGTGMQFGHPNGFEQYDVGIGFVSTNGGPCVQASIQDNGNPVWSYRVAGVPTSAAISVADGSGSIIAGNGSLQESTALFEAYTTTGRNPAFSAYGSGNISVTYKARNNSGNVVYGVAGAANNIVTGTAAGDAVIGVTNTKKIVLGRQAATASMTIADTVEFGVPVILPNGTAHTGANYDLVLADANTAVEMSAATAQTVTVPTNATVAFPIGTVIEIYRAGVGDVDVVPVSGTVTIRSPGALSGLSSQYSTAALRKRGTNEWVLSGDLS